MSKTVFYHAGCAVCVAAEQQFVTALNPAQYQVEMVHLGTDNCRFEDFNECAGIKGLAVKG